MAAAFSANAVDARARELRECATRRWLVKDELVFLLLHHKQQSAVPCLRALQPRPCSGTLLFYDTTEVTDFKKDGWRWQKRKDNSGRVREDRAKLVINREVIILGTYVHSAETPTFHRRNYYLRDTNQNVILVHYFDELHKVDPSMGALVPPKTLPLPGAVPPVSLDSPQPPVKGLKRMLPPWNSPSTVPLPFPPSPAPAVKSDSKYDARHSVDVIMTECFAMDNHDEAFYANQLGNTTAPQAFSSFDEDDALLSELTSLLPPESTSSAPHELIGTTSPSPPAAPPLVAISDFSPGWDFIHGGAKILICLATPLPFVTADNVFVQFGAHARSPAERISDTVLRCAAPPALCDGRVELFVCRCSSATASDCVQLSTTGRFEYRSITASPAPAPMVGSDEVMLQVDSLPDLQTYGTTSAGKRGRSPAGGSAGRVSQQGSRTDSKLSDGRCGSNPDGSNLSAFVDTGLDERQCKIRVVERLAEFQDAIRTTSTSSITQDPLSRQPELEPSTLSGHSPMTSQETSSAADSTTSMPAPLDDGAIEALSDQALESLSEQLIENVVRQLVTVAHTSEELLDELNSLDETGLSLLHYVSFYNYAHLIPLLLSHGAQVNQQSTQGQTPLHLAAGCGYAPVIDKLLEAGADVFALDFDGFTPAERAEKSGHVEMAQRLRQCMGEMTSAFMQGGASLESEIASHGTWADAMGEMDMETDGGVFNSHSQSSQERFAAESPGLDAEMDGGVDPHGHALPSTSRATSYVGENQEHNRKLLLGAFSTMSLHDKCALSLSISRDLAPSSNSQTTASKRRGSSFSEESVAGLMTTSGSSSASSPSKGTDLLSTNVSNSNHGITAGEGGESMRDTDVKSVIADDEENLNKLEAAMELMGPEEIQSLEEEARVIQNNVRAWLLRRNCRNMRETTKKLHEAAKSIEDQQKQQQQENEHRAHNPLTLTSQQALSERERAAVTVQAAARTMLARKSFLQTRNVTIKVQAATRGVLCRKHFARMKTHALASLVIQRNVREWLSKNPTASSGDDSATSTDATSAFGTPAMASRSPTLSVPRPKNDMNESESESDAALVRELHAVLEAPPMASFGHP